MIEGLDLTTQFDEGLREVPLYPEQFRLAVGRVKSNPAALNDPLWLGRLGVWLRILGHLDEAEATLRRALRLRPDHIANRIRLGHVLHWAGRFSEAHAAFDRAEVLAVDHPKYKDFIYQHRGKCLFDQGDFEAALRCFLRAMVIRARQPDRTLADSTRLAIEMTKARFLPTVSAADQQRILANAELPAFVREVLGQEGDTNCIHAALAFHGVACDSTPLAFLEFLRARTVQLEEHNKPEFGDFYVWWNRSPEITGQALRVSELDPKAPDFPRGWIFDHVAVLVEPHPEATRAIVFNKPSPERSARFRLDTLKTASYPSCLGEGATVTRHKRRSLL